MSFWVCIYPVFLKNLCVDQGSVFTTSRWKLMCETAGMKIQFSGIESHTYLGIDERFHTPLQKIFINIKTEAPAINRELALKISLNSMDDTMGTEGLVPTFLVFGILLRLQSP